MENKKEGFISYVLVCDTSTDGILFYYQGYFINSGIKGVLLPVNTSDFFKSNENTF